MSASVPAQSATVSNPSTTSLPCLAKYTSRLFANPLWQRVTNNWQAMLMDVSTVLAVTGFAITFFTGSTLLWMTFGAFTLTSAVSGFYMRRLRLLADLETTAQGLKVTKEQFEGIAKQLHEENDRLIASNRELQSNNEAFRVNNQNLQQTNAQLTEQVNQMATQVTQLTTQVTQLTLQVTQLQECAERIRTEVARFQQENTHLHVNIRALDQQILNSRALCQQITTHLTTHHTELGELATQRQGLAEQLEQLKRYLRDLGADSRVHERILQLATLQEQTQQATTQLHQLQLEYATERANFQTIREALVQLRNQFDAAIQDAAQNNQQLRSNVSALAVERERIHNLLSLHFPATTRNTG